MAVMEFLKTNHRHFNAKWAIWLSATQHYNNFIIYHIISSNTQKCLTVYKNFSATEQLNN
jgi:hypothetical protein